MSRETSPYILGDFWLDKRRDGKAPDIWQIARYAPNSRSVVYLSTKCRTLEAAKPKIEAHYAAEKAKEHQSAQDALVIPQLILYIRENKDRIKSIAQSKSSMRCFIGFLMQDEVGIDATFASLTPSVWKRFIKWRQGPHAYEVEWDGSLFSHASDGVSGEAIQRNLDDVRAALNHALAEERVSLAPRVPGVDRRLRSKPREALFTVAELGAIVGYARSDPATLRWVLLMIGTIVRPDAALAFDPARQDHGELVDLHPPGWDISDKHYPWVPVIDPLRPILDDWKANPHAPVKSRKTWWRTMRTALGLPQDRVPKTIRHSVATHLRRRKVPGAELSSWMGHTPEGMKATTARYAKYDPSYLGKTKRLLTTLFREVETAADRWAADHLRTTSARGRPAQIVKVQKSLIK